MQVAPDVEEAVRDARDAQSLVPLAYRVAYTRMLSEAGSVSLEDARGIERDVFLRATRSVDALSNAEDPLASMVAAADVAQAACAAYCVSMQRVALFALSYCTKLRDWLDQAAGSNDADAGGLESSTSAAPDPQGKQTWQQLLGSLDDASAADLAAKLGGWGGWTAILQKREAEALEALLRGREAEKRSIYTCSNPQCGSNDVDEDIVQARSLDEGHTVFLRCNKCGTRSKLNT